MSTYPETILELLSAGADDAIAISAPGRTALSYGALRAFLRETLGTLRDMGAGRNDAVAIVLPNGPEMALSFFAVASGCTAAPLNPSYRADEFEFYLKDLDAKLLIVEAGKPTPAIDVAQKMGLALAELTPTQERGAGTFTLAMRNGSLPKASKEAAVSEDIALV